MCPANPLWYSPAPAKPAMVPDWLTPRRDSTGPAGETAVRLHIGRLSLDGFSLEPGQERRVRASLEKELGRLLTEEALPDRLRSGGAVPYLPGGALNIAGWKDPADLGRQIARALMKGLQR
jgi:hypothetical protein